MELQLYFILCKRVEIEYIDCRVIVGKKQLKKTQLSWKRHKNLKRSESFIDDMTVYAENPKECTVKFQDR